MESRTVARRRVSDVRAETRNCRQGYVDSLSPGRRMELAYRLSKDAIEFFRAGMRAQGFSEEEIRSRLRSR